MATGDSQETFRLPGMDCSEEVATFGRAVKPLSGVLGVRANIVASTATIYHDAGVKARFGCGGKLVWREGGCIG
jgi:copper chaperone CopZ